MIAPPGTGDNPPAIPPTVPRMAGAASAIFLPYFSIACPIGEGAGGLYVFGCVGGADFQSIRSAYSGCLSATLEASSASGIPAYWGYFAFTICPKASGDIGSVCGCGSGIRINLKDHPALEQAEGFQA